MLLKSSLYTIVTTTLSENDQKKCEGLITKDECYHAIFHCAKPNKSNGLDGIPIEFYKIFLGYNWKIFSLSFQ